MKNKLALILAGAVAVSTATLVAAPAEAKEPPRSLTITTVVPTLTPSAAANSKVVVRAAAKKTGRISIRSKSLTVTNGSTVVAYRVPTAKLAPGTYSVATRVKYRTYTLKKKNGKNVRKYGDLKVKTRTQTATVNRPCATFDDFESVIAKSDDFDNADTRAEAEAKLHTTGYDIPEDEIGYRYYDVCDSADQIAIQYSNGLVGEKAYFGIL